MQTTQTSSSNGSSPDKGDLFVVTGAGGFIAGSLVRYFTRKASRKSAP